MKADDIRALSSDEILARIDDAREKYFNMRFQYASGQLTDTSQLKVARRDIARLVTIHREFELDVAHEGGAA
jgi:large subunit ribosomal protein L29